jgi:hypothetical protein
MDEIGNSASEEMPELTETFENKNNNLLSVCLSCDWRTLAHQWLCRFHCVL